MQNEYILSKLYIELDFFDVFVKTFKRQLFLPKHI